MTIWILDKEHCGRVARAGTRGGPDLTTWRATVRPVKTSRLLEKARTSPASLRFAEARAVAEALGFNLSRVSGSHHIFTCPGVPELLNLQEVRGMAKPYQVRQLLRLVERYNLVLRD